MISLASLYIQVLLKVDNLQCIINTNLFIETSFVSILESLHIRNKFEFLQFCLV